MIPPQRIFLSCLQSPHRHAVPACDFWAGYFRNAFDETGHTCLEAPECDWAEGLLPLDAEAIAAWRQRTWTAAIEAVRREHARAPITLFLSYLFPQQVDAAAIAEIRALGIPCVNFFCDNVREFRRVPAEFHFFDLHWVPEKAAGALYQRAGLAHLYAPMPCWVPPAHRQMVESETLPITFVGTRDEQRERLFAEAIELGLNFNLRGTGWGSTTALPAPAPPRAQSPIELARRQVAFARQHGWTALVRKHTSAWRPTGSRHVDFASHVRSAPVGDDYWTALREATVCLGVNRYPSLRFPFTRPDSYSRLRDIEAPMAGACYLTEWTPGIDDLYELGTEIETYRDAAELVAKAIGLAGDPSRRQKLRLAGQQRALRDHSIARTIERLVNRL